MDNLKRFSPRLNSTSPSRTDLLSGPSFPFQQWNARTVVAIIRKRYRSSWEIPLPIPSCSRRNGFRCSPESTLNNLGEGFFLVSKCLHSLLDNSPHIATGVAPENQGSISLSTYLKRARKSHQLRTLKSGSVQFPVLDVLSRTSFECVLEGTWESQHGHRE